MSKNNTETTKYNNPKKQEYSKYQQQDDKKYIDTLLTNSSIAYKGIYK